MKMVDLSPLFPSLSVGTLWPAVSAPWLRLRSRCGRSRLPFGCTFLFSLAEGASCSFAQCVWFPSLSVEIPMLPSTTLAGTARIGREFCSQGYDCFFRKQRYSCVAAALKAAVRHCAFGDNRYSVSTYHMSPTQETSIQLNRKCGYADNMATQHHHIRHSARIHSIKHQ
jgi:hypothetical protein